MRAYEIERAAGSGKAEVELDRRMLLVEAGEDRRQQVGAGDPGCSDRKGPDLGVAAPASARRPFASSASARST